MTGPHLIATFVSILGISSTFGVPQGGQDDLEGLGVLSFDTGPTPGPARCPQKRVIPNFDIARYMGRWYELERFDSPFQNGDCACADYSLGINGTFNIITSEYRNGKPSTRQGRATPAGNSYDARFYVNLPDIPEGDGSPNYNVITTDYANFAVIYTCATIGFRDQLEFAWIMARRPTLPENFLVLLKNWLKQVNIDPTRFRKTNQILCPYSTPRPG